MMTSPDMNTRKEIEDDEDLPENLKDYSRSKMMRSTLKRSMASKNR